MFTERELKACVIKAIHRLDSFIIGALNRKGKSGLCIVVLNPQTSPWKVRGRVGKAVLLTSFVGINDGRHPYDTIALSKAEQLWRMGGITGIKNSEDLSRCPFLLQPGDAPFSGGVSYYGLVVAVSGLDQENDGVVAKAVARQITAICGAMMKKWMMCHPKEDFFPEED